MNDCEHIYKGRNEVGEYRCLKCWIKRGDNHPDSQEAVISHGEAIALANGLDYQSNINKMTAYIRNAAKRDRECFYALEELSAAQQQNKDLARDLETHQEFARKELSKIRSERDEAERKAANFLEAVDFWKRQWNELSGNPSADNVKRGEV